MAHYLIAVLFAVLSSTQALATYRAGTVTSAASKDRLERVTFGGGGGDGSTCSSSPCVTLRQSGGFNATTRTGAGVYVLNFASGVFSGPPTCVGNGDSTAGSWCYQWGTPTSTAVNFACRAHDGALIDSYVHVHCVGPR